MSYSITVKAVGGELTVTSSGQVPDGEHQVSGHEDATQVNVGVTRKAVDGKSVIQASAWRPQEV